MSTGIKNLRMPMILFLTALFLLPVSLIYVTSNGTHSTIGNPINTGSDCDSHRITRAPHFAPILECDENTTKTADPGDLVVFNCTVMNEGNMTDDYEVTSSTIPGWNIILYPDKFPGIPPVTSPAPESERIRSLTVRAVVGFNATVGNYYFEVTLRSQLSPSNTSKVTFTVRFLPLHRIDIISPQQKSRLPGEKVMYEFQVRNTGNVDDTYEIWVESSDPDWVVILADDSMETLNLHIGNMEVVPVIVFIPQEVDAGHIHLTTFAARLKDEPSAHVERGTVETMVSNLTRIKVDQDERERTRDGILGDDVTFTFEIINKGNNLDTIIGSPGTFLVSRSPDTPFNWLTFIDNSSLGEGGLPKDQGVNISFRVTIPPLTPPGIYEFLVNIYSDIPLTFQDKASFTVNVLTLYNTEMEFNVTSKEACIGDNVSFSPLLSNTGNVRDTYTCKIESDHTYWIYIKEPTFTVDLGDACETVFNVRVPRDTPPGTYDFLFTLFSEGDENISFEQRYELKVAETLDFSFSVSNETHDAVIGREILVPLTVANTGNVDLPLSLDIFGEPWGTLGHNYLFIRFYETEELTLTFRPPHGMELTEYTFLIVGEVLAETGTRKIIIIDINVTGPEQGDEYFDILFSGGAYELQIEGKIENSNGEWPEDLEDYPNSWSSIPDEVFQERYIVSDASELEMTIRADGNGLVDNISDERYSLVIMKVQGDDAAAIVLYDMGFEDSTEEHTFIIEWPLLDGPYSMLFIRLFKEKMYEICTTDMTMGRNESDTYNIIFHGDEYDLAVTKLEADGNPLTVEMKDMPLEDSDLTGYEVDWSKVVTGESDAVVLSYRDDEDKSRICRIVGEMTGFSFCK